MNLSLLLPAALLALSALLIPLVIHLSRRSEQKPTDFAALRWISAQLRPRRKLVFQEIPLLLLRLLLLMAIVFFLAKPVSMQASSPRHWVAVVLGSDTNAAKNLPSQDKSQWHWLSPGFPDYKKIPAPSNDSISSLLRELDAKLPANTALTVLVPEQLSGLDGERIRLSRKVDWKIVPGKMPTTSNTEKHAALRPAIRHDEKHAAEAIYFRAAFATWQEDKTANVKDVLDVAGVSSPIKNDRNVLVWLSAGELPIDISAWVNKGGTLLLSKDSKLEEIDSGVSVWRNDKGKVLLMAAPLGQGRVLQWQQDLKPEAMPELLDADFPSRLKLLLQAKPSEPTRAFANSQTPLTGAPHGMEAPQSLQIWLALLIALLFLMERWLANAPRRWSAT